jgi:hypothetical protein
VGSLQRRDELQPLVDCHDADFMLLPGGKSNSCSERGGSHVEPPPLRHTRFRQPGTYARRPLDREPESNVAEQCARARPDQYVA